MNPHSFKGKRILNPSRLPVPPPRRGCKGRVRRVCWKDEAPIVGSLWSGDIKNVGAQGETTRWGEPVRTAAAMARRMTPIDRAIWGFSRGLVGVPSEETYRHLPKLRTLLRAHVSSASFRDLYEIITFACFVEHVFEVDRRRPSAKRVRDLTLHELDAQLSWTVRRDDGTILAIRTLRRLGRGTEASEVLKRWRELMAWRQKIQKYHRKTYSDAMKDMNREARRGLRARRPKRTGGTPVPHERINPRRGTRVRE